MAVYNKQLTVYFYALEPVLFFDKNARSFESGAFPLADVLDTIRKADPADESYRIREDIFGGETFCLIHDDGPEPILGAYYKDHLAVPMSEYKGELSTLVFRDGEALVDAAYAAFLPNDVVGLVRTSSKAPGFARIGEWLTYISGYGCGLFAIKDVDTMAQLDRDRSKLRGLRLRIRSERIGVVDHYSTKVASALRSAADIGSATEDVGIELWSRDAKHRARWAEHLRQEIADLIGALPDFEEAKVSVSGSKKPINLLRSSVQASIKVTLVNSKRIGPAEAAKAIFEAYGKEKASIELALATSRSQGS